MAKRRHNSAPHVISCVKNHAGYVREEDEYSTNPDNLYISRYDTQETVFEEDQIRVDHKEVIDGYVAKLKGINNRLKTEKNPKEINKLNKIKASIMQNLFNERQYIEQIKHVPIAQFIASLER